MRASDYIGISEGIRSREIKLQNELSEINSKISSLQNTLDSLESELDILEMELDSALSDTDEDGNVDMRRVGAIRARMSAVSSQIGGCQSELSEEENKKQKIETELQTVETEKQQTLSQIQSAANVKNQNLSRLSGGLSGDYASIGQNLQSAFQASLGQLSQAASILGGSISVAANGGTGGGTASSNQPAIKSSGNMAMVGGMGSRNSSTSTSSAIGTATQSAPTELISVTPSVSHGSSKKSPQTESRSMSSHKQSGDGGNQALLSPKTVIPLSQPESVSINNDEATSSTLQGDIPSSPHAFKDYLNPVNYDSNGHYTGDYRSPVTQTAQALQDYNNWSSGGGIGLPSIDLRQNGGVMQSIVPAQNIFEVLDADSPDFWSYKSRPQSDYIAMATYIPLVRKHLESGKSLSDIEGMGGTIGACATNYFRNPVKVMKAGDAYIHCNDGRHRTVAAQIAKVEMPVCIVQDYSGQSLKQMTNIPIATLGSQPYAPIYHVVDEMLKIDKKRPDIYNSKYGYFTNPTSITIQSAIKGGRLYLNDNIAHGNLTYVVSQNGDLIIGKRCNPNNPRERSPHPTLIGGHNPPVQCAGIISCVKGRILSYNNESGHYKPNLKSLTTVESIMAELKQTHPEIFAPNYIGGIAHE